MATASAAPPTLDASPLASRADATFPPSSANALLVASASAAAFAAFCTEFASRTVPIARDMRSFATAATICTSFTLPRSSRTLLKS